jgi:hypothetical protein
MKIAVCFSGQIRTGIEASPSLFNFFGELLPNIDFFIHTWDTETISRQALNGRDESIADEVFIVSSEKIEKIKNVYNPKLIKVDNVVEYCLWRSEKIKKENNNLVASLISMFHSIYESNQLKLKYEKQNNFRYDYVIRMRFDTVFNPEHRLSEELEQCSIDYNSFYFCDAWKKYPRQLEDVLWLSSSEIMNIVCDILLERETKVEHSCIDWQEHLKEYIERHQIPIRVFKRNELYVYRDFHVEKKISPFNISLL